MIDVKIFFYVEQTLGESTSYFSINKHTKASQAKHDQNLRNFLIGFPSKNALHVNEYRLLYKLIETYWCAKFVCFPAPDAQIGKFRRVERAQLRAGSEGICVKGIVVVEHLNGQSNKFAIDF